MKFKELIRIIEADGWFYVTTKGSHRQYKHPTKSGKVTINGKPNQDVDEFLKNSILKQAKLK